MYACTIEVRPTTWLSFYTKRCETKEQASTLFERFAKKELSNAEVIEVWETTEKDWVALMLFDKEVL